VGGGNETGRRKGPEGVDIGFYISMETGERRQNEIRNSKKQVVGVLVGPFPPGGDEMRYNRCH